MILSRWPLLSKRFPQSPPRKRFFRTRRILFSLFGEFAMMRTRAQRKITLRSCISGQSEGLDVPPNAKVCIFNVVYACILFVLYADCSFLTEGQNLVAGATGPPSLPSFRSSRTLAGPFLACRVSARMSGNVVDIRIKVATN